MSIIQRLDVRDTEFVTLERSVPTGFNPGEAVPVAVTLRARAPLRGVRFFETPSPGLRITQGTNETSMEQLGIGEARTLEYRVQTEQPGRFSLSGQFQAQTPDGLTRSISFDSLVSTGFTYSRTDTELYRYERWINPASAGPGDLFTVTLRITPKNDIASLQVAEELPDGAVVVEGEQVFTVSTLRTEESVVRSYAFRAGTGEGTFGITGGARTGRPGGDMELTTPFYVFFRVEIASEEDRRWQQSVGPLLIRVVNPDPVNQHLFLANGLRLIEERLNVGLTAELRQRVSRAFFMEEISGIPAAVGGAVTPGMYLAIAQGDVTIFPVEEVFLEGEDECEEFDEDLDPEFIRQVKETPQARDAGPDPGLGANFDTVLQIQRTVFDLFLRFFVNSLRAAPTATPPRPARDRLPLRLPLGLGTFTGIINSVTVPAIRPSMPTGRVFADFRGEFDVATTGLLRFLVSGGSVSVDFNNVGVELTKTPGGLPTGLKVILSAAQLGTVRMRLRGLLGWLLNLLVPPILRFGVWLALRLIRTVDIPIYELTDAFNQVGLAFGSGSPVLTAIADSALLATDFKPHDGSGQVPGLQNILPPGTNLGVAVNERLLNQLFAMAMLKGYLPQSTSVGGFRLTLRSLRVSLQPGIIAISGQLRAKRRGCLCGVKARIRFHIEIVPRVETNPANLPWTPPFPVTSALVFNFNVNVQAKVGVGGFLGVALWLTFGVLLVGLWALLNHVFNNNLNQLVANAGSQIINNSLSAGTAVVHLSIPNLSPSGLLGVSLQLILTGVGLVSLTPFEQVPLDSLGFPGQTMNVGFSPRSIEVDDQEIRLAVALS